MANFEEQDDDDQIEQSNEYEDQDSAAPEGQVLDEALASLESEEPVQIEPEPQDATDLSHLQDVPNPEIFEEAPGLEETEALVESMAPEAPSDSPEPASQPAEVPDDNISEPADTLLEHLQRLAAEPTHSPKKPEFDLNGLPEEEDDPREAMQTYFEADRKHRTSLTQMFADQADEIQSLSFFMEFNRL